jgi:hypothetical protein
MDLSLMYAIIFIAIAALFTLWVIIKNWMDLSFDLLASVDRLQSNCLTWQAESSRAKAAALKAMHDAQLAEKCVDLEAQPIKLSADLDAPAAAPSISSTNPIPKTSGPWLRCILGLSSTRTPDPELPVFVTDPTPIPAIVTSYTVTSLGSLGPKPAPAPAPSALAIVAPQGLPTITLSNSYESISLALADEPFHYSHGFLGSHRLRWSAFATIPEAGKRLGSIQSQSATQLANADLPERRLNRRLLSPLLIGHYWPCPSVTVAARAVPTTSSKPCQWLPYHVQAVSQRNTAACLPEPSFLVIVNVLLSTDFHIVSKDLLVSYDCFLSLSIALIYSLTRIASSL